MAHRPPGAAAQGNHEAEASLPEGPEDHQFLFCQDRGQEENPEGGEGCTVVTTLRC